MKIIEIEQAIILKSVQIECAESVFTKLNEERRDLEAQLEELKKPEPRFYKGQPVLVKNKNDTLWRTGLFNQITGCDYYHCQTTYNSGVFGSWEECKPDLDFKTIPNWIEWNGAEKGHGEYLPNFEGRVTLVLFRDGSVKTLVAGVSWRHEDITDYAVISLPEWM